MSNLALRSAGIPCTNCMRDLLEKVVIGNGDESSNECAEHSQSNTHEGKAGALRVGRLVEPSNPRRRMAARGK